MGQEIERLPRGEAPLAMTPSELSKSPGGKLGFWKKAAKIVGPVLRDILITWVSKLLRPGAQPGSAGVSDRQGMENRGQRGARRYFRRRGL